MHEIVFYLSAQILMRTGVLKVTEDDDLWHLLSLCAGETPIHHCSRNASGIFNKICKCHVRRNEDLAPRYSQIKGNLPAAPSATLMYVNILNADRSRLAETP